MEWGFVVRVVVDSAVAVGIAYFVWLYLLAPKGGGEKHE